jgi:hypothetical protein
MKKIQQDGCSKKVLLSYVDLTEEQRSLIWVLGFWFVCQALWTSHLSLMQFAITWPCLRWLKIKYFGYNFSPNWSSSIHVWHPKTHLNALQECRIKDDLSVDPCVDHFRGYY